MPVYSALLLTFMQLSGGSGETMTAAFEDYSNRACALVKKGDAGEATLDKDIYTPLSAVVFGQLTSAIGNTGQGSAKAGPFGADAYAKAISQMSGESRRQTNSAAGVADTLRARYQELYTAQYNKRPDSPSFRDHAPPGDFDRAAISAEVRLYCGKIGGMGITEPFPPKPGKP